MAPVKFVALLSSESYAVTSTGGVIAAFGAAVSGCTVNRSWLTGPGSTAKASLVSLRSPSVEAISVEPALALSRRRAGIVATPCTGVVVPVAQVGARGG